MVFCCFDGPNTNANDAYQRQTGDVLGGNYPGASRMIKTGGNALQAAPVPPHQYDNNNNNVNNGYQQRQPWNNQHHQQQSGNDNNLLQVVVPPGVLGGQMLQVSAPDGRIVQANVPYGMSAGSIFMVELPAARNGPPVTSTIASTTLAPTTIGVEKPHDYSQIHVMQPPVSPTLLSEPFVTAYPVGSNPNDITIQALPMSNPSAIPAPIPTPIPPPSSSRLLKVQVPPGTSGGTVIHVQVPGENRTISAQVPQGATEFHVSYEPAAAPIVVTAPSPSMVVSQYSGGEKLLLVAVPPGTAPGSTLHVGIPGEPGRVVAATVPPGVSQFHVSYIPHGDVAMRNNGPLHGSFQNAHNRNGQHNGYNNNNRGYNSNNRGYNNSGGGGMGSMMLPMLGGAALGAGLMSIFDHSHQAEDSAAYQQDTGDYGGGDYGGFDGGGDDGGYGGGDGGGGGGDY